MAQDIFRFVLVESGKATYEGLATKDPNTMYAITETKEIYFDGNLVADKNVFISETVPTAAGIDKAVYVVTGEVGKGIYVYDATASKYNPVLTFADFLTASGVATLTNKTIDAESNTISNISVANMKGDAVATAVSAADAAVDTKVVTEKAVRTELDKKVDKVEGKSLVADTEIAKLATVAENANNYIHPELATGVTAGTAYNKVTFDATGHVATATAETTLAGLGITDAYTKDETDSKLADLVEGLTWKEAVATYDAIATTYPNPEEGWTVSVQDTNNVYRYDEESGEWVNLFQAVSNIVEASTEGAGGHAGLMTAAMAEKLNSIQAGGEVNQNAYAKVKVGEVELQAAEKSDVIAFTAGTNITLSAEEKDGVKTVTIGGPETYIHPSLAEGVNAGTAYNKVTFDDKGHVASASAETTLKGLGVVADSEDVTTMKGYQIATEKAAITEGDTLNQAIGKLEYRVNTQADELEEVLNSKLDDNQLVTSLTSTSTDEEIPSAKAVYDAMKVVRL